MGLFDAMGGGGMTPDQQKYIGTMGLLGLAGQLLQGAAPTPVPRAGMAGALGKGLQQATMNAGEAMKDVRLAEGVKSLQEQSALMKAIKQKIEQGMANIDLDYGPKIGLQNAALAQPKLGQPMPQPLTPGYTPFRSRQMGLAPQIIQAYPQIYGF